MNTYRWTEVASALELGKHEHVAVVGGGGKTTLMFALASQLAGRRLITTTTKMGADQDFGRRVLIGPDDAEVASALEADHQVVVWGRQEGTKVVGVDPARCDRWFAGLADHVLVEADGARRQPFKAPKEGEPVMPQTVTRMVIVMGADALGRVIFDRCHRPLRVAALAGCQPSDRLTPERAAQVLSSERGFLRHLPRGAQAALVVTKVGDGEKEAVEALVDALGQVGGTWSAATAQSAPVVVGYCAEPPG